MELEISLEDNIGTTEVIELYKANGWSSAEKPKKLIPALKNSDTLVTARISGKLVGIGNAISDGSLVVYYPHMLVHPDGFTNLWDSNEQEKLCLCGFMPEMSIDT